MKLYDIFTTASSNMFRSKLRTLLTIIAIFIGAFTLTLTTGLGSGISAYIDKVVGDLGAKDILVIQGTTDTGSQPGPTASEPKKYDPAKKTASIESEGNRNVIVLTDADLAKIRQIKGVKSVDAYRNATVDYVYGADTNSKYLASLDHYISGENYSLDAGRLPKPGPDVEVLIPSAYLKALGYASAQAALNQSVHLGATNGLGQLSEVTAPIVGVMQASLISNGTLSANDALVAKLREVTNVGLPPAATANFQAAIARFDPSISDTELKALKDRIKTAGYDARTVEDQIGTFKAVINGIIGVLDGFAIIALLAASFGIINTLLMSVQERTKEIGLMKAMGMGSGRIFLLFSFEAALLGFWGSLLGALAAMGAGQIINRIVGATFLKDLTGLVLLRFQPVPLAVIVGIVMAIAFLAGTLPAIRAARQSPIDSLRYE
ncbi:MAG TPA: ABC transporter permease [Candidatus Saccharimonadia bacterium]